MTTVLDLLYVALFAVAFPLWDYLVSWPAIALHALNDLGSGIMAWQVLRDRQATVV